MNLRIIVVSVTLALCYLTGARVGLAQETQKRDLSRYEQGGEFVLRDFYGQPMDNEDEAKARAREFIWDRWQKKRLAHCSIVRSNAHGDSRTTHYYVEPDSEGRWRVAVEVEDSCCGLDILAGKTKTRKTTVWSVKSYYLLSRMDAESRQWIPEREKRRPETYTLLLQDGKPHVKYEIPGDHWEVL